MCCIDLLTIDLVCGLWFCFVLFVWLGVYMGVMVDELTANCDYDIREGYIECMII